MNKLLLVILDGWGIGKGDEHDAIAHAQTPFLKQLWVTFPHSTLVASGEAVGLLVGQMGSSEVGHMHIGAGRVIRQELTRIHHEIATGTFFDTPALVASCHHAKRTGSTLHLVGLLSDGGVHSHIDHLLALITLAKQYGVKKLAIHAILDGRDAPPQSAIKYLNQLTVHLQKSAVGAIATVMGRFYAMDRNNHLDRTNVALDAMINGKGATTTSIVDAITASEQKNVFDEFVEPIILNPNATIKLNDSVVFFNFRADRMRQLVAGLVQRIQPISLTTFTPYGVEGIDAAIAFSRQTVENHFTQLVSEAGFKQLKIAETQKYAHVTYFFNGTREQPYPHEDRILVPSKHVKTFDRAPEMSAQQITNTAIANLPRYSVIVINYANADMVGHTGNIAAAITACTTIDQCLALLVPAAQQEGFTVIITADHGNAEQMFDPQNNTSHTAHTTNPVPLWFMSKDKQTIAPKGTLTNVAALALSQLGIQPSPDMDTSL